LPMRPPFDWFDFVCLLMALVLQWVHAAPQ
jgi:hypothetical protein